MHLGIALRAFWKALTDAKTAERLAAVLDGSPAEALPSPSDPVKVDTPAATVDNAAIPAMQNAAVTLLATLQRDARLIDLIHEDLDQYGDAQVGAAARPCLKQCRQSLDRLLGIVKLEAAAENAIIDMKPSASTRYRWVGEGSSSTKQAKLIHPGWMATRTELPRWTGSAEDALVIAPAQVQATT